MHSTNPFACLEHAVTAIVPLWGPAKLAAQQAAKTQADARRLAKARAAARAAARTKAGRERRAAKQRDIHKHEPPPRRRSPQTPVLCAYAPREGEAEWDNSTLPDTLAPPASGRAPRQPAPTKLSTPSNRSVLTMVVLILLGMGVGTAAAPIQHAQLIGAAKLNASVAAPPVEAGGRASASARRALQDTVAITDANIFAAVAECEAEDPACTSGTCSFDCPVSQATYGRIADWDVSGVTTFNNLGAGCSVWSRCGRECFPLCLPPLLARTLSARRARAQCSTRAGSTGTSRGGARAP